VFDACDQCCPIGEDSHVLGSNERVPRMHAERRPREVAALGEVGHDLLGAVVIASYRTVARDVRFDLFGEKFANGVSGAADVERAQSLVQLIQCLERLLSVQAGKRDGIRRERRGLRQCSAVT